MKVNSNITNLYTNKTFKKGLEFAADNGALFAASTVLACSVFVRPAAIWLTPKTSKENKKIACAKSLASSFAGYLLMLGISKPVAKSIKKIDKNPEKYLTKETINNLRETENNLKAAKAYILATQTFKLGIGLLMSIPKALLTSACLPIIMQNIFNKKNTQKRENISFKGKNDKLAEGIGKVINKQSMQDFSKKYKDSNFPMHVVASTDLLTTATFIRQTQKTDKIEEQRKKALIFNTAISTGLSIISSYIIDKLMDKPTEKFIENFKKANRGQMNLEKQVEGIRIAKPILIMAGIYYTIIPFISTFLAEKAEHNQSLKLPHSKVNKTFKSVQNLKY